MTSAVNPVQDKQRDAPGARGIAPQDSNDPQAPGGLSQLFTTLLIAQIKNQDPLSPMESSQFVTQFAQMSQVESTQALMQMGALNASMQESMLVVSLGSPVGSMVMAKTDSVELGTKPVHGGFTLDAPSSGVDLVLTGPDGAEHRIALGPQQAGNAEFTIDPARHGLAPGRYDVRIASDSGEKPQPEILGELRGVRVGAGGKVLLSIDGVGEAETRDITRFLGRGDSDASTGDLFRKKVKS